MSKHIFFIIFIIPISLIGIFLLSPKTTIQAQTSDTTPPSIPTNLTATVISSSQINLSWTASTDDTAVAGYNIYRCTGSACTPSTLIDTSSTNSYSDTGLSDNTAYTYVVSAYDGVGNASSNSGSASMTTAFMISSNIHYVSPNGLASWEEGLNVSTPTDIQTAFLNAAEGDQIYLRGGTYNIVTTLETAHNGSANDDAHRIIVSNYPNETPLIVSDGLGNTILIENEYWTFKGLSLRVSNMVNHDHGIFRIGYNHPANYTKIVNCQIELVSTRGRDNVAAISLQASRSSYAYIYNNILIGSGTTDDAVINIGIQYLGGGNIGTKILNNEISDFALGIYVKHANGDTSLLTGAEIAYNYIHDCYFSGSTMNPSGLYGQPTYINIHDNITDRALFGDNGGGEQGHHSVLNHNTFIAPHGIELWNPSEGPIHNFDIRNNIFPDKITYGTTEIDNAWDYNMYGDDPAIGSHDLGVAVPVYTGGTNPTTIAGFALTSSSSGYQSGDDGKDMGANISLVGRQSIFPTQYRADVDNNSQINTTDAMLTLRNSLGLDMSGTNWQTSTTTGDADCNGSTTSTDAMLILRYSLGLEMSGTGWCVE